MEEIATSACDADSGWRDRSAHRSARRWADDWREAACDEGPDNHRDACDAEDHSCNRSDHRPVRPRLPVVIAAMARTCWRFGRHVWHGTALRMQRAEYALRGHWRQLWEDTGQRGAPTLSSAHSTTIAARIEHVVTAGSQKKFAGPPMARNARQLLITLVTRARFSKHEAITRRKSSRLTGLVMNSSMPASMQLSFTPVRAWPVMAMMAG